MTSLRIDSGGTCGAAVADKGWVVIDPGGWPYAWYGPALAIDAAAAMAIFEPRRRRREQLCIAGWSVRAGSATELVANTGLAPRVSA